MRVLQKKGGPSLNKDPAHLYALPGSERPRLFSPGNNSSEVRKLEQIANRLQCNIKTDDKEERTYSVVGRSGAGPSDVEN